MLLQTDLLTCSPRSTVQFQGSENDPKGCEPHSRMNPAAQESRNASRAERAGV